MALEQEQRITFDGKENIIMESEEVKITPPARRKKAEKLKKITGGNTSLPACDGGTSNDGASNTQAADISLNQGKKENREPINKEGLLQEDVTNTESHETKNGVLKDSCVDKIISSDGSSGICVENSFVGSHDLAANANDTKSVLRSNENEAIVKDSNLNNVSKDDTKSNLCLETSQEECIGPQDEESFFSAGEEAETSQDLSVTLSEAAEVVNETSTELENVEDPTSVNSENSNKKEETITLTKDREEICGLQNSDQSDQRSTLQVSEESLENLSSAKDTSQETLNTKTSSVENDNNDNVSDTVRTDSPNSDLLVETELGAVGGAVDSESDSDQEWSSSSYTSSEGEYDVSFAEGARGIQEVS